MSALAQQTFDFPGEEQELRRVGGRIGAVVLEFCRSHVGCDFHACELWVFVNRRFAVAPDSPRRILSLLATHGYLTYVVLDRARSLYRITGVV